METDLEALTQANEAADTLIEKLQRIAALWEELPTVDEINDYGKACTGIDLSSFKEQWEELPTVDEINGYAQACTGVDLSSFKEQWEELPTIDEIKELAEATKTVGNT